MTEVCAQDDRGGFSLSFFWSGFRLGFRRLFLAGGELRDLADGLLDVIDGDQARAFELAQRALVPRTPQEVLLVEAMMRIVLAAVAVVVLDHALRRCEPIQMMGKSR